MSSAACAASSQFVIVLAAHSTFFYRRLLIPGNSLMTAGGKAIAGMLLSNGSLFCLDVSNNYLGPAGIEAMAKAIAKNT